MGRSIGQRVVLIVVGLLPPPGEVGHAKGEFAEAALNHGGLERHGRGREAQIEYAAQQGSRVERNISRTRVVPVEGPGSGSVLSQGSRSRHIAGIDGARIVAAHGQVVA